VQKADTTRIIPLLPQFFSEVALSPSVRPHPRWLALPLAMVLGTPAWGTDPAVKPSSGGYDAVVERIRSVLAKSPERERVRVLVGNVRLTPSAQSQPEGSKPHPGAKARAASKAPSAAPERNQTWAYSGPQGPDHWAQLKPEYAACAGGQRQAPVQIDTRHTLQGPAEPLQLDYNPSSGQVVHAGQGIRVDVAGQNLLTVRGSRYQLQHLQFHHPAEVRVDGLTHTMAVHLLHRNDRGHMVMLVVPLEPGDTHHEIDKLWTHMPLEVNDRVPLPDGVLTLNALLPHDASYYQFMGSLSSPPCTEGVLWLVMKQPVAISPTQIRLFSQLFPMNARPVQALNGRVVREGM
jgi:carbonic anhydrase